MKSFICLLQFFLILSLSAESILNPEIIKKVRNLDQSDQKPFTRAKTQGKVLALTFDDGPNAKVTEEILAILKRQEVKATFFVVGKNVKKNPELLARVHTAGHEVGNHSINHPRLPELDVKGVGEEIFGAQAMIEKQLGFKPLVFRAPYLKHDEKVWKVLGEAKLFSLNAAHYFDFKEKGPLEEHAQTCVEQLKPGAVILIHERPVSLKFLEDFIKKAKAKGFRFLRASELLTY